MTIVVPVRAQTVTITTIVPDYITVRLDISGLGYVEYAGQRYNQAATIDVRQNCPAEFTFFPKAGYQIGRISYNGENQRNKLNGNRLVITPAHTNTILEVVFSEQNSWNPTTGDTSNVYYYYTVALFALLALFVIIKKWHRISKNCV